MYEVTWGTITAENGSLLGTTECNKETYNQLYAVDWDMVNDIMKIAKFNMEVRDKRLEVVIREVL